MAKKKSSFKSRKAGIAKMWKTAKKQVEETPDMFGTVEKGKYLGKLVSAKATEIGDKNWKNFAFVFEIQEGDEEGSMLTRRCGLETEENLTYLVRDLQKIGVDTDDLEIDSEEELNELGEELVSSEIVCRLRVTEVNDAGFQNVYIDKLISSEDGDEDGNDDNKKSGDDDDKYDDLVGKTMGFQKGKKMLVGKILSFDEEEGTFKMKTDAGKKVSGDLDDLEEPEDANGDDEIAVGAEVIVEYKGSDVEGVVKSIDEDEYEAVVVLKKPKKKITVALDELYIPD